MNKIVLLFILWFCSMQTAAVAGTAKEPGPAKAPAKPVAAAPAIPTSLSPENGAILDHGIVGFVWTRSSGTRTPTYEIQVSLDPDFTSPVISIATQTASYVPVTELASGTYFWRVKETSARKQAKAWSPAWRFTVIPVPLITMADNFINNGIVSTNSATVSLALSAKSGNGIAAYAASENAAADASDLQWVPVKPAVRYDAVVPFVLSRGDGMKTVSVRFKDRAGRVTAARSAVITLDTTPPHTTITSHPDDPSESASASFFFTSTKPGSVFRCSLDDGVFEICYNPPTYKGLLAGRHTFAVRATDAVGNSDPTPAQYSWETTLPLHNTTSANFINRGATATDRATVHLSLSAVTTQKEGVSGYFVSEHADIPKATDPGWMQFPAVRKYARQVEYTLSEGTGRKVLYVWFKDSDGNVSGVQSDTIERVNSKYWMVLFVLVQLIIIL